MKVVQVGGTYVGAQKSIERAIHNECIERGNESLILYAVGSSDEENIERYESIVPSLFRRAFRKYLGKNPRFARWSTNQLIRRLQKYQPDLINLHVLHQGYVDYERLFDYLIEQKIPVVYTMHDMWAFTGGCYYYFKENCIGFQTDCSNCHAVSNRLDNASSKSAYYLALKKRAIANLSKVHFVAVSQWVADEMKKSFLAEYSISVVENGIEPISLSPDVHSFNMSNKAQIKLLFVAMYWDERKGIDRIFEMARILGKDYQFFLVGSAAEEVMREAPKNIRFLGYISDKSELMKLYAGSDLYISASLEETFGMTFVEAAFAGTRSIGYATTAVKSTLEGVYGIAVSELSAESMAMEIIKIVNSGNAKLSSREVKSVVERYSCDTMAKKYCDIYDTILEKESHI